MYGVISRITSSRLLRGDGGRESLRELQTDYVDAYHSIESVQKEGPHGSHTLSACIRVEPSERKIEKSRKNHHTPLRPRKWAAEVFLKADYFYLFFFFMRLLQLLNRPRPPGYW